MTLINSRCARAMIAVMAAVFISPGASAGPISGTAELTNGSISTVGFRYVEEPADVSIREFTTVPGRRTILGEVSVNGTTTGDFNLGAYGQSTHAHEATFNFTETITNLTGVAQSLSLDFLVSAGELMTNAFEAPPNPGEFLEAGFDITMRFAGNVVFQSSALLRQIAGGAAAQTVLTTGGTDLGGLLTLPRPGSTTTARYSWGDFLGNVDLGNLAAGATGLFEYDVRTFVGAEFLSCSTVNCGNTRASIGDPFSFNQTDAETSSIGALSAFVMVPALPDPPVSVPEPGTLWLFVAGLLGLIGARRKI